MDISNVWGQIALPELLAIENEVAAAHEKLMEGAVEDARYRGWLDLPTREQPELFRILLAAERIRNDSDVCVVVGIGGSCLGARAAVELLQGPDHNLRRGKGDPQILFAGNTVSSRSWNELMQLLDGKDFSLIAVSKSGDTLEPAIAFRNLRWMLERKYGTENARKRIYTVTDPEEGALRQMARKEGWESFDIPADVSGRFSVLTPAGLLPMAVAGIDVAQLLNGAAEAAETYRLGSFENPVWLYAAVRNLLYRGSKTIELLGSFEPGFRVLGLWWQQLFGRSEGRDGKGLFQATAEMPADLHSLGQLIQNGLQNLFETVVRFEAPEVSPLIGSDWGDLDGLNYLEGKKLSFVEESTSLGMIAAHADSGVPVIVMECGPLNEQTVGELLYFLELCCCVSADLMGVDLFARPGVDDCQQNVFRQLGKPGCE